MVVLNLEERSVLWSSQIHAVLAFVPCKLLGRAQGAFPRGSNASPSSSYSAVPRGVQPRSGLTVDTALVITVGVWSWLPSPWLRSLMHSPVLSAISVPIRWRGGGRSRRAQHGALPLVLPPPATQGPGPHP